MPFLLTAVAIGALAVALTSVAMRRKAPVADTVGAATAADSATMAAPADSALDIRWRGGRQNSADCMGTFEVTAGRGTNAGLIAAVMDKSGAVMATDSAYAKALERGDQFELRFRRVDCDRIDDWQLQVVSPRAHSSRSP